MRLRISDSMLAMMVAEELQVRTYSQDQFTAYEVTRALRKRQPHIEIRHNSVRHLVHQYMRALVAAGTYESALLDFNGESAILYEPAPPEAQPGIPGVPLLHLN